VEEEGIVADTLRLYKVASKDEVKKLIVDLKNDSLEHLARGGKSVYL
jgi:hypothetical protein